MPEPIGRLLGVDLGDKRTGLAVCDDLGMLAVPLETIEEPSREKLAQKIVAACKRQDISAIVIGLPYNMDGSEGPRARLIREFSKVLAAAGAPTVHFQDERLTSWEAEGKLIAAGVKRGKRKGKLDAAAAQMILQAYLDRVAPRVVSDAMPDVLPPHKPSHGRKARR